MERDGQRVVWEACQTLNGSWGYDRDNLDWKSPELLVRLLMDTVAKGGNLLLNVGPTGRGEFDPRARQTLAAIGEWTRLHGRAIYGCTASDLPRRPTAASPRTATASTSTSSPGPSATSTSTASPAASSTPNSSTTPPRSNPRHRPPRPGPEHDMAGTAGTLTLELPIQSPAGVLCR